MNGIDPSQTLKLIAAPVLCVLAYIIPESWLSVFADMSAVDVPLRDILGIGGPLSILSWHLYYHTKHVQPRIEKQQREERLQVAEAARKEREADQINFERILNKLEVRNEENQKRFLASQDKTLEMMEKLSRSIRCNVDVQPKS